ncbi:hypothetical protein EOPP23_10605 [Endozoicomonas sp. OPT23]|nr:hypothetical protein [Endozoicomonas sp. OPT23]
MTLGHLPFLLLFADQKRLLIQTLMLINALKPCFKLSVEVQRNRPLANQHKVYVKNGTKYNKMTPEQSRNWLLLLNTRDFYRTAVILRLNRAKYT